MNGIHKTHPRAPGNINTACSHCKPQGIQKILDTLTRSDNNISKFIVYSSTSPIVTYPAPSFLQIKHNRNFGASSIGVFLFSSLGLLWIGKTFEVPPAVKCKLITRPVAVLTKPKVPRAKKRRMVTHARQMNFSRKSNLSSTSLLGALWGSNSTVDLCPQA